MFTYCNDEHKLEHARGPTDTHLPHLHDTCFTTHKHFCVSLLLVQQRALLCPVQTCFVGKSLVSSRGIVVRFRDVGHIVVALWLLPLLEWSLTAALGRSCVWLSPALAKLDVSQRLSRAHAPPAPPPPLGARARPPRPSGRPPTHPPPPSLSLPSHERCSENLLSSGATNPEDGEMEFGTTCFFNKLR